ncbi:MAG: DUF3575 domain-containing protein [Dysgonamonadaceae bacterium]|nr:DUF3575 domain-containing protein [Dysgonamonadaceae bacterium]
MPFKIKALIFIYFFLLTPPPPPAHHNQLINSRLRRNSAIIAEQEEFSISPDSRPTIEKPKLGGIKTNLILLGAGLANIGIEHPLGDRFSVDLSFIYSPYTIKRDWKFRTLGIQPELRWWWKESMKGHFLGLHGHLLYYNVAWDDLDRYQDREGRTPLWGAGLSYGYTLPVHKRWNLEFTIGAGYAHLIYDSFYNVGNGAKYSTDTKDYWGITRVGITLVYKLKMD